MTKLKIKVTKDILERSKYCGRTVEFGRSDIHTSCAIALSLRDIFPNAYVKTNYMYTDINLDVNNRCKLYIMLPISASDYIDKFDSTTVEERPNMPEIEFEIEIPESIIEKINIEELKPLLQNHPTLQLIEN